MARRRSTCSVIQTSPPPRSLSSAFFSGSYHTHAHLSLSNTNRTGLLGAAETAVAFAPLTAFVNASTLDSYKQQILAEIPNLRPGQQKRYKMIADWLSDPKVGQAEL